MGTFSPIPLLLAIFDVFSETFCINYANFPDFNFFGKIVSSFGDKLFFFQCTKNMPGISSMKKES